MFFFAGNPIFIFFKTEWKQVRPREKPSEWFFMKKKQKKEYKAIA